MEFEKIGRGKIFGIVVGLLKELLFEGRENEFG
jgi:hypothetical protein